MKIIIKWSCLLSAVVFVSLPASFGSDNKTEIPTKTLPQSALDAYILNTRKTFRAYNLRSDSPLSLCTPQEYIEILIKWTGLDLGLHVSAKLVEAFEEDLRAEFLVHLLSERFTIKEFNQITALLYARQERKEPIHQLDLISNVGLIRAILAKIGFGPIDLAQGLALKALSDKTIKLQNKNTRFKNVLYKDDRLFEQIMESDGLLEPGKSRQVKIGKLLGILRGLIVLFDEYETFDLSKHFANWTRLASPRLAEFSAGDLAEMSVALDRFHSTSVKRNAETAFHSNVELTGFYVSSAMISKFMERVRDKIAQNNGKQMQELTNQEYFDWLNTYDIDEDFEKELDWSPAFKSAALSYFEKMAKIDVTKRDFKHEIVIGAFEILHQMEALTSWQEHDITAWQDRLREHYLLVDPKDETAVSRLNWALRQSLVLPRDRKVRTFDDWFNGLFEDESEDQDEPEEENQSEGSETMGSETKDEEKTVQVRKKLPSRFLRRGRMRSLWPTRLAPRQTKRESKLADQVKRLTLEKERTEEALKAAKTQVETKARQIVQLSFGKSKTDKNLQAAQDETAKIRTVKEATEKNLRTARANLAELRLAQNKAKEDLETARIELEAKSRKIAQMSFANSETERNLAAARAEIETQASAAIQMKIAKAKVEEELKTAQAEAAKMKGMQEDLQTARTRLAGLEAQLKVQENKNALEKEQFEKESQAAIDLLQNKLEQLTLANSQIEIQLGTSRNETAQMNDRLNRLALLKTQVEEELKTAKQILTAMGKPLSETDPEPTLGDQVAAQRKLGYNSANNRDAIASAITAAVHPTHGLDLRTISHQQPIQESKGPTHIGVSQTQATLNTPMLLSDSPCTEVEVRPMQMPQLPPQFLHPVPTGMRFVVPARYAPHPFLPMKH